MREATVVLDGILDYVLELQPEQHSTDTAGWTDIVFALFDLLGMAFAPKAEGPWRNIASLQARRDDWFHQCRTVFQWEAGPRPGGQALGRFGAHLPPRSTRAG